MSQQQFNVEFYILLLLTLFLTVYGMMPNIGDVRLFNQSKFIRDGDGKEIYRGEIQIYLSDGHSPSNWSKICKTDSFDPQETTILCEQLNLTYDHDLPATKGSDYPTLLTNVECDHKNFLHILQCKYHFGQTECAHVVNIQCSKSDKSISNGRLEICSPDQVDNTNGVMSASFGIVGIRLNNRWRGIKADQLTEGASNIADLMCVSSGYQRSIPGSIGTVQAFAGTYTFKKCVERYVYSFWINMMSLVEKCKSEPQYQCLGCCYRNPEKPTCSDVSCYEDFFVLQCTYDFLSEKREVFELEHTSCIFSDSKYGATIDEQGEFCPNKPNDVHWQIATGVLSALLFLTLFTVVAISIYCWLFKKTKQQQNTAAPNGSSEDNQNENTRLIKETNT